MLFDVLMCYMKGLDAIGLVVLEELGLLERLLPLLGHVLGVLQVDESSLLFLLVLANLLLLELQLSRSLQINQTSLFFSLQICNKEKAYDDDDDDYFDRVGPVAGERERLFVQLLAPQGFLAHLALV